MPEFSTQQLSDDIARALSPEDFDVATQRALAVFDGLNAQIIADDALVLACRAGCSLCCSLRVDTFAHEIFYLAHYLQAHRSAEELSALVARLAAHRDAVTALTPFEHATRNIPCVLLRDDGCCGAYEARPQSCRRHHSLDFARCQFTYDHPEDLDTPAAHDPVLYPTLTEAMGLNIEPYARSGYDCTIYELGSALHEALTDPESWPRWHAGEPAFLQASVTPSE